LPTTAKNTSPTTAPSARENRSQEASPASPGMEIPDQGASPSKEQPNQGTSPTASDRASSNPRGRARRATSPARAARIKAERSISPSRGPLIERGLSKQERIHLERQAMSQMLEDHEEEEAKKRAAQAAAADRYTLHGIIQAINPLSGPQSPETSKATEGPTEAEAKVNPNGPLEGHQQPDVASTPSGPEEAAVVHTPVAPAHAPVAQRVRPPRGARHTGGHSTKQSMKAAEAEGRS